MHETRGAALADRLKAAAAAKLAQLAKFRPKPTAVGPMVAESKAKRDVRCAARKARRR